MEKKIYITPFVEVIVAHFESILCGSVGGNTGYDSDDVIGGGDLSDDDDF